MLKQFNHIISLLTESIVNESSKYLYEIYPEPLLDFIQTCPNRY